MTRPGVTEEQVARAADALVLAGERPTIERVRAALGTGSPNTLLRHLDAWWKGLGKRLTENRLLASVPEAPREVSEAASALWRSALKQADVVVQASLAGERQALEMQQNELAAAKLAADRAIAAATEAASAAAIAAEKAQLWAQGLEKVRDQQQARIEALETELSRERIRSERLASDLGAANVNADAVRRAADLERETASRHLQAVENRAHREIDHARGELAKAGRRITELEKQLAQTQAESTRRVDELVRDLRRSEGEAAVLRLKLASGAAVTASPSPRKSTRPVAADGRQGAKNSRKNRGH